MDLQEILGSDYQEGMTAEDVNAIFEKRVLASGKYENKDKVDAERKRAKQEKADLEAKIKGKMSEDELSKQELEDLKAKLAAAEEREKLSKKETSKLIAKGNMEEIKSLLEIKDTDKEFTKFMEAISVEDNQITSETSGYVKKLVKEAYEKGKSESTKQNLGEMGKRALGADGKEIDPTEAFVKSLAASSINLTKTSEQSNFI